MKVVLCGACTSLDMKKIVESLPFEVKISRGCRVEVDGDFIVFGCPAIPIESEFEGSYEVVDLRLIEKKFKNPEKVAAEWIKAVKPSNPDVEVIETKHSIIYEGRNPEIVRELSYIADLIVVTDDDELISELYPFKHRVIKGEIKSLEWRGEVDAKIKGRDLLTGRSGVFYIKAGQAIVPEGKGEGLGIHTYGNEYLAALKAATSLGSLTIVKPVKVDKDRCGAVKSGIRGCTLCLSCPEGAIVSNDGVNIDYSLCTACGFCYAVCPVSAIENTIRTREDVLDAIDAIEGEHVFFLCEHALKDLYGYNGKLPEVSPIVVPCVNSLSEIELLYAALKGKKVTVYKCEKLRSDCIKIASQTLKAFGFDGIEVAGFDGVGKSKGKVPKLNKKIAEWRTKNFKNKREAWFALCSLLKEEFALVEDKFENEQFGMLEIANCTLCQTCTFFCPSGAIRRDVEKGLLFFTHALCFACGLCEKACPEGAIVLKKVLDFSRLSEEAIYQVEMIHCPACGKPHISRPAYEKLSKVVGKNSMLFCPECRPRIILEAAYEEIVKEREAEGKEEKEGETGGKE